MNEITITQAQDGNGKKVQKAMYEMGNRNTRRNRKEKKK